VRKALEARWWLLVCAFCGVCMSISSDSEMRKDAKNNRKGVVVELLLLIYVTRFVLSHGRVFIMVFLRGNEVLHSYVFLLRVSLSVQI